ncbi:MAG: hypothetical protein K2Q32_08625 [Alphaproteobacteria bacterium]|nr:hypothetical protein [Alphaproteobacteria bacterium]
MKQKASMLGRIKPVYPRKSAEPTEITPFDPMKEFMEARNCAHKSPVDLNTPIPDMGAGPLPKPKQLIAYFVITKHENKPGILKLKMPLRDEHSTLYGVLSLCVRMTDSSIEMFAAAYEKHIDGYAPYALRHFLAAFKDIQNVRFSTASISFHNRAEAFSKMGFELFYIKTGKAVDLAALTTKKMIPDCEAVLDFKKAPIKHLVFNRLGLSKPTKPNHLTARSRPRRRLRIAANEAK